MTPQTKRAEARKLLKQVYIQSGQKPYASPEFILNVKEENAAKKRNWYTYEVIQEAKSLLINDWEETTGSAD